MAKQKIRPCHKLGQLFLRTPGHSLTPDEIYDALQHEPICVANCGERAKANPRDLYRLPIWIGNLTSENSWNGNHGGADIVTEKRGRKVIRYTLKTPEKLNIFGQVMNTEQQIKANVLAIEQMQTDAGPVFPGMYNTITDSKGRVVPNDATTGEPLLDFWKDLDQVLVLSMPTKTEIVVTEPIVVVNEPLDLNSTGDEVTETIIPDDVIVADETFEEDVSDPIADVFMSLDDDNDDVNEEQTLVLTEEAIIERNKARQAAA